MERYAEIILSITAFELMFLAVLILVKKTHSPHFKILGIFLFTKALCVASALLGGFYKELLTSVPYLFLTGSYLAFTFGPLIYLFIRSLTSGKGLRLIDSVHFIPLVLAFAYFSFTVFIKPVEAQASMLINQRVYPSWNFFYLFWGVFFLLTIGYLVFSWIKVVQYNREIRNHVSSLKKIKTNWLFPVIAALFIIIIIDASNMYIAGFQEVFNEYKIPVLETAFLIFANIFVYIGLTQAVIIPDYSDEQSGGRYLSSKLALSEKGEILQTIRTRMSKDLLYLDPELSVEKLSKISGKSPRNISQVINEILNENFYEFVNSYRINAAKEQLADPEDTAKTVLEILYAVGFNSKSVFNSCFKKMCGQTPTEYRKQKLAEVQVG